MAYTPRATLKGYFNTGDIPTEAQFAELIDTIFDLSFTSSSVALSAIAGAGIPINEAHSLGAVPKFVMGVLVCTTAEYNYSVGDEVSVAHIFTVLGNRTVIVGANSTNVWATATGAPSGSWAIEDKTSGAGGNVLTPTSWALKVYARP